MKKFLENQYKNLFLWTPFVLSFGVALYFSLDKEPNFHLPWLITLLLGAIIIKNKNILIKTLALFLFGFFYSFSFTNVINTPQLKHPDNTISINGYVSDIDFTEDSFRAFIKIPANQINSDLSENKTATIRISFKDTTNLPDIGDNISGTAKIFHPSPKFAPDSFDFARWAYFNKLSGSGFMINYTITKNNESKSIRTFIHDSAKSNLTDALILGYKKSIPEQEAQIWKTVGIGHVWSISGFHMTLVGGWLFALFYLIFRSFTYITKRIPAKYPAICCAWFGLLFYLCISGISVATIRAFLMTTLIFTALVFGRNVLSLRNAALAFIIIFLINPFYIMTAGFQLSFAAIFGLLWFFENKQYIKRNLLNKISHIVYMSFMTAVIATIFTLPFIITHFGYIPLYSLIGNIIILPIFSIAIMPLIAIGTICSLFGNFFFINITNKIYVFALHIAEHISNLPFANIHLPHLSNTILLLFIFGLLSVVLIRNTDSKKHLNYLIACIFILSAVFTYIIKPYPVFFATDDHELVGFVHNNKIEFNKSRSSKHFFAFNTWRTFINEPASDTNNRAKCQKGLCIYKTPNWNLAYMQKFTTIMNNFDDMCEDKSIKYIVTTFDIESSECKDKILHDGILIYPSGKVVNFSNHRPWHIQH